MRSQKLNFFRSLAPMAGLLLFAVPAVGGVADADYQFLKME
jgi:hypothetical protein